MSLSNTVVNKGIRVLAIDPTTHGFGFAVLEGKDQLIDWGVRSTGEGEKNEQCLNLLSDLIDRYGPEVIVVEDYTKKESHRCSRVRELLRAVLDLASEKHLRARMLSRVQVKKHFAPIGARSKHDIAKAVAKRFPELAPRLPPYRQPWMSEDYRMAIFDSVGLALTFYELSAMRRKHSLSALGINNHVKHQEDTSSRD